MNIKQAKDEIKNTILAYMRKDAYGHYKIPEIRQRPILLMGPPGIGKTAIMAQIASECNLGLVAYTITHHTRQSAIGLPYILDKSYDGKDYKVTEYTMSEIIASVYDQIETSGHREGILFIDEINCVSETLAPTMLQFLQGKTFGDHKVPEGWIICAAGNPQEYNKSVRDFDIVTLDRVKRIDVQENFDVWKTYGYQHDIHGSILSYLEIKKENFYSVEMTIDGKRFVTARGWEDLSEMIKAYEELDIPILESMIIQYIQHPIIAKDFANYYDLYKKYEHAYDIEAILHGKQDEKSIRQIENAGFDEKVSVIGLMVSRLNQEFIRVYNLDEVTEKLFAKLKAVKAAMEDDIPVAASISEQLQAMEEEKAANAAAFHQDVRWRLVYEETLNHLSDFAKTAAEAADSESAFDAIRSRFSKIASDRQEAVDSAGEMLTQAFEFLTKAFGESQEMVIFLTELNLSKYCLAFLQENGCDAYYRNNKTLLFGEQRQSILGEIGQLGRTGFTNGGTIDENWYGL